MSRKVSEVMTDQPNRRSERETRDDAVRHPDKGSAAAAPRWVKVFGVVTLVLFLVFVITHLVGSGLGSHAHSVHP